MIAKENALLTRLIIGLVLLLISLPTAAQDTSEELRPPNRCINLGNMLESPTEGEWGFRVRQEWLQIIADAGFDTVRIPISWSTHADTEAPYTIDETFFARIDEVVGWALDANLQAIINIHHYEEMMRRPAAQQERLLALWQQIAERYQDYPDTLIFETLNEPNGMLNTRIWSEVQLDVLDVIRQSNPDRRVVIGAGEWNSLWEVSKLDIPENRENLIFTFHNYQPFEFTHQGAEWVDGSNAWLGREWPIDSDERGMETDFRLAGGLQERLGVPFLMGEFGAYSKADLESRVRFTRAMVEQAEANGIGWCYWEFAAGFGIYNPNTRQFNEIYEALIPQS
jgi:endoglucanase